MEYPISTKSKKGQEQLLLIVLIAIAIIVVGAIQYRNSAYVKDILSTQQEQIKNTEEELTFLRIQTETLVNKTSEETRKEITNLIDAERTRLLEIEKRIAEEERKSGETELQLEELVGLSESNLRELEKNLSDTYNLTSIIGEWRLRTANVICDFTYRRSSGSGILLRFSEDSGDIIGVLTNRHVLADEFGNVAQSCVVAMPNHNKTFLARASAGEIGISSAGYDFGRIVISEPDQYVEELTNPDVYICADKAQIGNELIIIGYPLIGARGDITATDGIISGYDGDYYITSAKVEQGNSGGTAVMLSANCLLGVPTFVQSGSLESLARILDINVLYK